VLRCFRKKEEEEGRKGLREGEVEGRRDLEGRGERENSLFFFLSHLRHGRSASRALLEDAVAGLLEGEEEEFEASGCCCRCCCCCSSGSRGGGGGGGGGLGEGGGGGEEVDDDARCSVVEPGSSRRLSATELLLPPFAGAARATCRGRVAGVERFKEGLACAGKGTRRVW